MGRVVLWGCSALAAVAIAGSGCHRPTQAERAAAEIAAKNAAARGGLEAWRAVRSMSMSGTLEAGTPRNPVKLAMQYARPRNEVKAEIRAGLRHRDSGDDKHVRLPFVMQLERPRKSRLEITFQGKAAVQVYDGARGWKVRPFLGRHEVEPFTPEELRLAAQQSDLDGPLLDYAAKGGRASLVGSDDVDGRPAFDIEVTAADGQVRHVWVDEESYLDVKVDGTRRMDGRPRTMWTAFRDYKAEGGLMIPHTLETTVAGVDGSEKIVVDHVVLNPELDDAQFKKPD